MKIRSLSFVALLALLVCVPGSAQQANKTGTKHSLWAVQGKSSTAHLFGSVHFLKKEFYPLPKPIEDAYAKSQVVLFEADLDEMQKPETQLKMLQHAKLPEGETLQQHVTKETYAKLQAYLGDLAGLGGAFDSMRPWMVAVALIGLELQKLGFNQEHGVDKYFFDKAKQDKKTIVPLETVDFQLGLFTGLTKAESDAMLQQTIQEISGFKKILTEMTDAWKTGDTAALDRLILEAMREYPAVHKKLLLDRNKDWAAKIEKLLAEGKSVFVVVGSAHLVGKDSLVDLLTKKGFKVQQQ